MSECLNQQSTTPCSPQTIGTMVFNESTNIGFTPPHIYGSPWSLGKKIFDSLLGNVYDRSVTYNTRGERIYIYCPPCGCLVYTALSICKELQLINEYWSICVRPNARLAASCFHEETRSERLESMVDKSKEIEAKTIFTSSKDEVLKRSHVRLLDRLSLLSGEPFPHFHCFEFRLCNNFQLLLEHCTLGYWWKKYAKFSIFWETGHG